MGLAIASVLALWGVWWAPTAKLRDLQWYYVLAGPEERKHVAEQILIIPFGAPHDAFIALMRVGDVDSIPYLLWGLRWQGDTGDAMVCTKWHCLDALKRITGHDAGPNYSDWAAWWESTGSKLPPSAFPLKEGKVPGVHSLSRLRSATGEESRCAPDQAAPWHRLPSSAGASLPRPSTTPGGPEPFAQGLQRGRLA